jgi:protein-S-isoprenylcysteine O-methyltransferase Ste14
MTPPGASGAFGLFALHALFYAVFVPRWLVRVAAAPHGAGLPHTGEPPHTGEAPMEGEPQLAAGRVRAAETPQAAKAAYPSETRYAVEPPRSAATAGGDAAVRSTAVRTVRGSLLPLALHGLAMGTLYCGLDLAVLPPPAARLAFAARSPGGAALALTLLMPPLRLAGGVAMLAASALAGWALTVFRSWRLRASLDPGHELCTAGPFRLIRNPIYLAMDLLALGSWLWVPTALVALGALLVALGGDLRARGEERLLLEVFGQRYAEYRRRVRRFLPGVY